MYLISAKKVNLYRNMGISCLYNYLYLDTDMFYDSGGEEICQKISHLVTFLKYYSFQLHKFSSIFPFQ